MAERVLYTRTDGRWAWRLLANNGAIIATDGGEGHNSEANARSMADRIIGGEFKDAQKKIIRPSYVLNGWSSQRRPTGVAQT